MIELSKDFSGAWERFERLTELRLLTQTHEWEWTRGRTDLFAFLVPVTEKKTCSHVAGVVDEIKHIPGVDTYPPRYWHATIKVVGFLAEEANREDEVTLADVERIAEDARPLLESQAPFEIGIGKVNAFPEVVFLEVEDGGAIRQMNHRLVESLRGLQRSPVDGESFLPHVSIARFESNDGLPVLKTALRRLRAEGTTGPSFPVDRVSLIQAHLAREAPTFDVVAEYPLRG